MPVPNPSENFIEKLYKPKIDLARLLRPKPLPPFKKSPIKFELDENKTLRTTYGLSFP